MTIDLFTQFSPSIFLGLPILVLALILPWIFLLRPSTQWLTNRALTLQSWFFSTFIKQIFLFISNKGHVWIFLLTSLIAFIITLNILGMLPYTFTPTSQLSFNLALAVPFWLATVILGYRHNPSHSLGHLLPEGTPTLLIPILIIIETISLFIRPLALGVRLTANLTAGHLLIQLISAAIFFLLSFSFIATSLTTILLLLLTILEIAVAIIQSYVFVLLLSLYLQENV